MLLSKKLGSIIVLIAIYSQSSFSQQRLEGFVKSESGNAGPKPPELMSDKDAMTPNRNRMGTTPCDQDPQALIKKLEQLENKVICGSLTPQECHAVFLGAAAGGTAIGGGIATHQMLKANRARVKPSEVICEDAATADNWIFNLIFSRAYAGQFCFVRSKSVAVDQADAIRKKFKMEMDSDMERAFAGAEIEETKFMSDAQKKNVTAKVTAAQEKLIGEAKKYLSLVEGKATESSGFTDSVKQRLVSNLKSAISSGNNQSIVALVDFSSTQWFPHERSVDLGRFTSLNREIKEGAAELKAGVATGRTISPQEVADRKQQIEWMKGDLLNHSLGEDHLRGKLKNLQVRVPDLDVEGILKQRTKWLELQRDFSLAGHNIRMLSSGRISDAQFMESMAKLKYQNVGNPLMASDLEHMAELAAKQYGHNGPSWGELQRVKGLFKSAAKAVLGVGKNALAHGFNPGEMVVEAAVLGMPLNCKKNIATMQNEGNDPNAMIGYNYMELDPDTCKPKTEMTNEFKEFLKLDPIDQVKLARHNPRLCGHILKLVEKNIIGDKYQITCNGKSGFTMSDGSGANKKVDQKVQQEMNQANLSPAEREEYLRMNRQPSNNHIVSVNGSSLSVEYPATTKENESCKQFNLSLTDQKNSREGAKCLPLTGRVSENVYDYAQIARCCAGDKTSYCDLISKNLTYGTPAPAEGTPVEGTRAPAAVGAGN